MAELLRCPLCRCDRFWASNKLVVAKNVADHDEPSQFILVRDDSDDDLGSCCPPPPTQVKRPWAHLFGTNPPMPELLDDDEEWDSVRGLEWVLAEVTCARCANAVPLPI